MTPVHAHAVIQRRPTRGLVLVTGVCQPAIGLEEHGGAEIFFAVPPVGRARCAAAEAENAFVQAVELLAFVYGLPVLTVIWRGCLPDEVWLDRFVLLVKEGQIWYEILDDVRVRERVDAALLACVGRNTAQASQCVNTINIHRATPTDTFTTTPPECE